MAGGQVICCQAIDGDCEEMPAEETPARTGVVYRSDDKSIYFELRTGG